MQKSRILWKLRAPVTLWWLISVCPFKLFRPPPKLFLSMGIFWLQLDAFYNLIVITRLFRLKIGVKNCSTCLSPPLQQRFIIEVVPFSKNFIFQQANLIVSIPHRKVTTTQKTTWQVSWTILCFVSKSFQWIF